MEMVLKKIQLPLLFTFLLLPLELFAFESVGHGEPLNLINSPIGYIALIVFTVAYILVMSEEFTHLRKSKPVIIAAGIIWAMIGFVYMNHGMPELAEAAVRHNLLEYAELMLFLLVAMTYINSMDERGIFGALRAWLIRKGFSFRQLFWMTGFLSFFMSHTQHLGETVCPIKTTALQQQFQHPFSLCKCGLLSSHQRHRQQS